jgi:hypothetical protein
MTDPPSARLTLEYGGEVLCLQKDSDGLLLSACNASDPAQGFALNATSGAS